jgi:ABC-2 type transport system permease protein
MKALCRLTYVEFKLTLRQPAVVFFAFVFPVFLMVMFGNHGAVDTLIPAYTGIIIAITGIISLPLTVSMYRERKILKRFKATPMKPFYILVSQVTENLVTTLGGFLTLFVASKLLFGVHYLAKGPSFILVFFLSIFSIFSFGFLVASIAPNARTATAIANLVYYPMLFLSGAAIPIQSMPKLLTEVSKVVPLTYVVDVLRNTWFGKNVASSIRDAMVLLTILVVSCGISALTFKWE